MKPRFDLARWAIANPSLTLFLMGLFLLSGVLAFQRMGQSEDPPFTFKIMFVRTFWPGASAQEIADQVTERIERAVMQSGKLQYTRSYSINGESVVLVMARDTMDTKQLPAFWYDLRKKIGDVRHTLPNGVQGPFFNDEYGETFGNIYAVTGSELDQRPRHAAAKQLERAIRSLNGVARIEILGIQDERVWIELSHAEMARLHVSLANVQSSVAQHFSKAPAGTLETEDDRISIRTSGIDADFSGLSEIPVASPDGTIRLSDIASIRRGLADPKQPRVRVNGQDAIAVAVSMAPDGDIVSFGEALDSIVQDEQALLPLGIDVVKIADQPQTVKAALWTFLRTLAEAVLIVLAATFLVLGIRAGLIVSLSIPLVLAITFAVMSWLGIGLHKISLGALVLALGLLVDDAIIAIESITTRMSSGSTRLEAAIEGLKSTAMPMLTGTLITAVGFLPIATALSTTGEFTRSIFQVVSISLIASWIVAVTCIPFLAYHMLRKSTPSSNENKGILRSLHAWLPDRTIRKSHTATAEQTTSMSLYIRTLDWCLNHPYRVIFLSIVTVSISIVGFSWVPRQFFPPSTRLELIVDLELPESSADDAIDSTVRTVETALSKTDGISSYACFSGSGVPRFYLPLDQKLPKSNIGQCLLQTNSISDRDHIHSDLLHKLHALVPQAQPRILRLENGPPVGFPIQYRITGPSTERALEYAKSLASTVAAHPWLKNVDLDSWERSKLARIHIDQERASAAALSTAQIKSALNTALSGQTIATLYEGTYAIPIVARSEDADRSTLGIESLTLEGPNATRIPLASLARIEYGFEHGVLWRRNGRPTVTVLADVIDHVTPDAAVKALDPAISAFAANLEPGYRLEVGGSVEDSVRSSKSVAKGVPLMLGLMALLIMLQLRRFSSLGMVMASVPLGMVGVTFSLLVTQSPFGFVALLGVIALAGMIMRNTIILIDQIDSKASSGLSRHEAIVSAAQARVRPILLTAFTAILAMVPLSLNDFFGPMAIAIGGGLLVATLLTLLVIPALYEAIHAKRGQSAPSLTSGDEQ